jgi:2-amino-4-hydroxy-6-hydroxymethyldihydropteridine diphosphokinase
MDRNIYLLLGTNLGDRALNLTRTRQQIATFSEILAASSIFRTEAWGKMDQPAFYNQVLEITTLLGPEALLQKVLSIEAAIGRIREEKWGPRIIDIDILFYQHKVIQTPDLTIPHAGIPNRRFTLLPLHEIAPSFQHPVLKKNISTLLQECTDTLTVEKI